MGLNYTKDSNGLIVFDEDTGEVLEHTLPKKDPEHKVEKYIGVEVKYPIDCFTVDHLIESLSQIDPKLDSPVAVDTKSILESIVDEKLTRLEGKLFIYICDHITAWNYYFTSIDELEKSGVSRKRQAQTLESLEKAGLIQVQKRDYPFKGDIKIKVNPWYAFRGLWKIWPGLKNMKYVPLPKEQTNRVNAETSWCTVKKRKQLVCTIWCKSYPLNPR